LFSQVYVEEFVGSNVVSSFSFAKYLPFPMYRESSCPISVGWAKVFSKVWKLAWEIAADELNMSMSFDNVAIK